MDHTRDLIGYGGAYPHPHWPGDAQLAVNFVINFEEGSEPSWGDGDGYSENGLTEISGRKPLAGVRDLAAEGMFAYGARAGFWRLKEIFDSRGIPFTLFACAQALERNQAAAEAVKESDADICCHGWRWIQPSVLTREEERQHIRQAVDSLARTMGERPAGWYCRYGPSVHTRELLVEEGGFFYDSDAYDDDLPYWVNVGGTSHLVVPYTLVNNDMKYINGTFATSHDYFSFHKDAVDVLCREGERSPKMMSVGLHMRVIGHPSRSGGLERLLDYIAANKRVWIAKRIDIARHWAKTHPDPGSS